MPGPALPATAIFADGKHFLRAAAAPVKERAMEGRLEAPQGRLESLRTGMVGDWRAADVMVRKRLVSKSMRGGSR